MASECVGESQIVLFLPEEVTPADIKYPTNCSGPLTDAIRNSFLPAGSNLHLQFMS